MNTSLFASKLHGALAGLILAGFAAWLVLLGARPGAREGSDRLFLIVSGWAALALMLVCFLYVFRKYAYKVHGWLRRRKLGAGGPLGPESSRSKRLREKQAALEKAEAEVDGIRDQMRRGILAERVEVSAKVREVLRRNRVGGLVTPVVRSAGSRPPRATSGTTAVYEAEPAIIVSLVPKEPLGRMARWLHSHFYYGLAFAGLVLLHGGVSVASPLGWAMAGLSATVVVTGLLGMVLFARGPTWLTPAKPDLGLEQCIALTAHTELKVRELMREAAEKALPGGVEDILGGGALPEWTTEPDMRKDLSVLLEQHRRFRAGEARLRRIRFWMNSWRIVHIPASVLLLAAVAAHVFSVWWY